MIQLSSLTKTFGDRMLFDNVTWQIADRERVGLCGPNGAGKTTLLKMMAGLEEPDAGAVAEAVRPDDRLPAAGRARALRAARCSTRPRLRFSRCSTCEAEMHALEASAWRRSFPTASTRRCSCATPSCRTLPARATAIASTCRSPRCCAASASRTADFERPPETFSGGWQMRIALAKLLLGQPTLLLLDEPTNHLDLDARNWLEEYLDAYPHAVILVSHDRFFLDAVVTRIADLTLRTLTDYVGNYCDYLARARRAAGALRKAKQEQDEEVARIKLFIDRFRYQATKAAQVQSRIKMLDKVVPIEVPPERKRIHFTFPACAKSGRTVLELKHVRKAYGDLVVFERPEPAHRARRPHRARRTERRRQVHADAHAVGRGSAGQRRRGREGHQVVMQYFAQDEATRLDPAPTVLRNAGRPDSPLHMVPMIRNILGGFLFSGDDVYKQVRRAVGRRAHAAGGRPHAAAAVEHPAARRADQPPRSRLEGSAARRARSTYGGTLIFVSHDRYFVERLATKIIEVGHGEAIVYPGTYKEFLWHKEHRGGGGRQRPSGAAHDPPAKAVPAPAGQARASQEGRRSPARPADAGGARPADAAAEHEARKRERAEQTRRDRELQARSRGSPTSKRASPTASGRSASSRPTMAAPGFYEDRDAGAARHRPPSGADVGSRRADAPVGRACRARSRAPRRARSPATASHRKSVVLSDRRERAALRFDRHYRASPSDKPRAASGLPRSASWH